jgi:hypothetical protein
MPAKAILFDADGVVIFPWRFARHLAREHGITPEMTRGFFQGVFEDCLVGKMVSWRPGWRRRTRWMGESSL